MKQLFKPIGLLFCMGAVVSSCSKKVDAVIPDPTVINPVSDYTVTPDPADGFTFSFKNLSKNYSKLEWRFGDDTVSTVENPTHTYVLTGDANANPKYAYLADLKTTSTTGTISHKYSNIIVSPEVIAQFVAVKDGVTPNKINLSVNVKAVVKTVEWTFTDADFPDPTVPGGAIKKGSVVKTTSLTASRTYAPGTFNTVSAKITTDKGSVVTITRNITSEGLVENVTGNRLNWEPNFFNNRGPNEDSPKLLDNSVDTKFLVGPGFVTKEPWSYPLVCVFTFLTPQKIRIYAVGSANDVAGRDPKEWTLEGSNDGGATWTLMDQRVMAKNFEAQALDLGYPSGSRFKRLFYYTIANPIEYKSIRWTILSNWGQPLLQLSEFQLFR